MSKLRDKQNEILSLIDAVLAILSKVGDDGPIGLDLKVNPFDFLILLIKKGDGINFETIVDWLAKFLTVSLPAIELAIKGVLLANFKGMVDCNLDPRIPQWIRMPNNLKEKVDITKEILYQSLNGKPQIDLNENQVYGLLINPAAIDYRNMLSVSPLSDIGQRYYSDVKHYFEFTKDSETFKFNTRNEAIKNAKKEGVDILDIVDKRTINNAYQLFRGRDFNGFLWAAIHKMPLFPVNVKDIVKSTIFGGQTISSDLIPGNAIVFNGLTDKTNTDVYICINRIEEPKDIVSQNNDIDPSTINTQIDETIVEDTIANENVGGNGQTTIVPISFNTLSANWYVDRLSFLKTTFKTDEKKPREYNKEFPVINVQYFPTVQSSSRVGGNLLLKVLPKPFNNIFVFDEYGHLNPLGHYTVTSWDDLEVSWPNGMESEDFRIYNPATWPTKVYVKDADMEPDDDGEYVVTKECADRLFPCYHGITVYELNYDLVMGMTLFDPVVMANQLIEVATSIQFRGLNGNVDFNVTKTETFYQMRVSEIVKNIVESTAYEVSDCFYSFDNSKYESMLNDAEIKRANMFISNDGNATAKTINNDNVYDILNEFDSNASLQEQHDVISRAITQATANITNEVLPEDKYAFGTNIVFEMIKAMVNVCVESLLSPKILILFEMNRQLMGNSRELPSVDDLLKSLTDVIVSVVKELRDMILQELLNWALEIITDLFNKIKDFIIKEQLDYYIRILRGLLEVCSINFGKRADLENKLDEVDYADIDEVEEQPQENNC